MTDDREMTATPHAELIAELMNPNIPKNEREHAAVREIERLQEALAQPDQEPVLWVKREYNTSLENQLRQSGIWFDRGRHSAFKEIAEKVKEMPWESDTKDSFLVWLKEQS